MHDLYKNIFNSMQQDCTDNFLVHVAISEDDMSVNECFGVHHQNILGDNALLIEVPSDRHGFPDWLQVITYKRQKRMMI